MTRPTRRGAALRALALLAPLVLALGSAAVRAQALLEARVKAAYLVKFLSYVDWPGSGAESASPLVIGVIGADAILDELRNEAAGRRVGPRPLAVRRLAPGDDLDAVHALYIGREQATAPVARALQRKPVLLVTDLPDGLAAGGVLNFVLIDGRVRFEASLAAAERTGLKLSSRLLGVAERVLPP